MSNASMATPNGRRGSTRVQASNHCRICGVRVGNNTQVGGKPNDGVTRDAQGWPECNKHQRDYVSWQGIFSELGYDLTARQAEIAAHENPGIAYVHQANRGDDDAWSHLDDTDRDRIAEGVQRAIQATKPVGLRRCTDGPCAWCGRDMSLHWTSWGHRRHDGTPAPLCTDCDKIADRRGLEIATTWGDQRRMLLESATGYGGTSAGAIADAIRAHAEIGGGDGKPWSHLDRQALSEARMTIWGQWPQYAPDQWQARMAIKCHRHLEKKRAKARADQHAKDYPTLWNLG
ncbi:hypothetical protein [Isoptericola sediminis]|uniref:Uncharacterized protein n=1 Tax=Isoptericola sediminis TaxID=2733572 RepID=A0A849KB43_9MICO|nr:hypothetical protein [Isoptericola sediminis]NNU28457.1 hypothetical protein [Isoptericola sediminis]